VASEERPEQERRGDRRGRQRARGGRAHRPRQGTKLRHLAVLHCRGGARSHVVWRGRCRLCALSGRGCTGAACSCPCPCHGPPLQLARGGRNEEPLARETQPFPNRKTLVMCIPFFSCLVFHTVDTPPNQLGIERRAASMVRGASKTDVIIRIPHHACSAAWV
jgi:hypothetical protein